MGETASSSTASDCGSTLTSPVEVERGVQEGDGFDAGVWDEYIRYAATPPMSSAETKEKAIILRLGVPR
jgi:hypothetical protein